MGVRQHERTNFVLPVCDRMQRDLGNHYEVLLFKLGLYAADGLGPNLEQAEQLLAAKMPSYQLGDQTFPVGLKKYKTAAFFLALAKEKGATSFKLTISDIKVFRDCLSRSTWPKEKRCNRYGLNAIVIDELLDSVVLRSVEVQKGSVVYTPGLLL